MSESPTNLQQLKSLPTSYELPPAYHRYTTLRESFKETWKEPLTWMPALGVLLITLGLIVVANFENHNAQMIQQSKVDSERLETIATKAFNHTQSLMDEIERLKRVIVKLESERK